MFQMRFAKNCAKRVVPGWEKSSYRDPVQLAQAAYARLVLNKTVTF